MEDIINGIELYDITDSVLNKYRNEAKQSKNISRDVLRRRLTSMILNAHYKKIESPNDTKYKFGGCYMHVNENKFIVTEIGWFDDLHSSYGVSRDYMEKFIDTNLKLGLNKKGTAIKTIA